MRKIPFDSSRNSPLKTLKVMAALLLHHIRTPVLYRTQTPIENKPNSVMA